MEASNCWCVVGHIGESGAAHVMGVTHDISLSNEAGLFEVAVGHVPFGVFKGHEVILDIKGEWALPDMWSPSWVKAHSAHARFGSISGPSSVGS